MLGPKKLTSSHVASIAYDERDSSLIVTFRDGSIYSYRGVPVAKYEAMGSSKSAGKYLHEHVKGKYTSTALNPKT